MKMRVELATGIVLSVLVSAGLAANEGGVESFDLTRVRLLDGPFKQIQELHRTALVGQLNADKLLFEFRRNAGVPQPPGVSSGYRGWDSGFVAGHYGGHYLSAAARLYAATGDASFRDKANYMVKVMAECQEKLGGGYLSAFPITKFERLEAKPRGAMVPYYTIHKILAGLLDVHAYCDNPQTLEVAAKMSDCFAGRIAKLTDAQVEAMFRTDYAGNPVNEFGGMSEALTDLYHLARKQGDPRADRHLKLAAVFNRDWLIDPLLQGQDKLDGLHGNTHVAQVSGIARYALESGDHRAGKAAEAFWKLIVHDHSFVTGSNGFNEKLRASRIEVTGTGLAALSPMTAETCNTHNMLKLTRYLFQRSPQTAYADYMELALYNHILAAIAPDTGHVTYFTPLRPGDFRTYIDEPYCCQGTGIENAARFGEAIYFHNADTLWVNLFIASTLDWRERGMKIRMETRYPDSKTVRLVLEAPTPIQTTLNIRIPAWVQGTVDVTINGRKEITAARPGTFLPLTAVWKTGDTIEINLPLVLRLRPSVDDPSTISLFYGPVLLAGELGREGMPEKDITSKDAFTKAPAHPAPVFLSATADLSALKVEPLAGESLRFQAIMVNPADQAEVRVQLAPLHRVHHQRFAVYWKVLTAAQLKEWAKGPATAPTQSVSFVGNPQEEAARNFQGKQTATGTHQGRRWRDAADGGWFSYRLPVDTHSDVNLLCTYWGGDDHRDFDIVVEDKTLATQTLARNRPGKFFDVAYRIPAELVRGKQFITVRFQAHLGKQAGGLFDCRILPIPTATPGQESGFHNPP